ncbi:MBL fold metallo-hydrolase [Silvibacterium dinghuense]|uniref:MBL fold metallo-hydrolase n=1 Tax=Silvibacterium dinghuense TaxID=1560006 RepID=A0A4Q1SL85_9BACT|nr:MBL fold metallo-hydrolase [Silvibacterium dinghuense]RXS98050.1 MBL fold metallo-hydrolase [Silvibacterium dinghuense]GGG90500.1 cyclase [Silvibacterium dinghuense]
MTTRRHFLIQTAITTGGLAFAASRAWPQQSGAGHPPANPAANTGAAAAGLIATMRTNARTTPIHSTRLTDTIYLLQGVGGNMLVHLGPDGKLLVDSGIATATPQLKEQLAKFDPHPLRLLVNTHWHFDHTDGNAAMHDAGAFILAHENTRVRLSSAQRVEILNTTFPPAPNSALPQETFGDRETLYFDNEPIDLVHAPNAHTDSDIFLHFRNSNVVQTGDLWFNGMYPLIDANSGGSINGMIRGVDQLLQIVDEKTKIIPGHGAPGDQSALSAYRDMLATVANRIEKLKLAGQSLAQVIAQHPTADLDATWNKGMMTPEMFVTVVYNTL